MPFPLVPQPKPKERHAARKKRVRGERKRTRQQVVALTWTRAKGRCERCGKKCTPFKESYPGDPDRGEVNDKVPVSLGGSRLDLSNQELLCGFCHYGGESGAHAPTPERMKKTRTSTRDATDTK